MRRFIPFLMTLALIVAAVASDGSAERRAALRALSARAADGDAKALFDLASLHDRGYDSIPVDSARSTALYRLSAEKGYPPAMNYLGFRYFKGEYVREDVDSALFWLVKAAGRGDLSAANNLGYLLANSDKVTRDYPQAVYWLSKAAEGGLPQGESQLADLCRQGLGTPADTMLAQSLYTKAIEGGLQDAELKLLSMMGRRWESLPADSAVSLGRYYYTHRAPLIGVTLFRNAASCDNPDALALLGDAYSRGIGVEYDHDRSLGYFLRAALLEQPSAQFVIGELLDIFPDALSDSVPAAILNGFPALADSVSSSSYWYGRAAAGGVKDADEASRHLLAPRE